MTELSVIFILIYLLTLLFIAADVFPLCVAALVGVLFTLWMGLAYGVFTYDDAIGFVDMKILGLLIGTMVFMEVMYQSGLFRIVALCTVKVTGGNPRILFVLICIVSAAVSMFLSDTAVLLLVAVAISIISEVMDYDPVPYIVSSAIMVNLGGTSTLIGSVGNMIIGVSAGLSFSDFIWYLTPCELILWGLTTTSLYLL